MCVCVCACALFASVSTHVCAYTCAEVKHEIDKLTSSQRLDMNLERGWVGWGINALSGLTVEAAPVLYMPCLLCVPSHTDLCSMQACAHTPTCALTCSHRHASSTNRAALCCQYLHVRTPCHLSCFLACACLGTKLFLCVCNLLPACRRMRDDQQAMRDKTTELAIKMDRVSRIVM